jgi:phenylalanine-4-hydroxylase
VISKKKNFIDYLDELGLFIGFIRKKKFRRSAVCRDFMAVQMKNFVRSQNFFSFFKDATFPLDH